MNYLSVCLRSTRCTVLQTHAQSPRDICESQCDQNLMRSLHPVERCVQAPLWLKGSWQRKLGTYGRGTLAVVPNLQTPLFYKEGMYHFSVEGVLKDSVRRHQRCGALAHLHQRRQSAGHADGRKAPRAALAITGTMADPVAHISTMKMDDGMLVVDSALGHLVQGLALPRRAEHKQDLEAMACVPAVVACVVVSVCERALVACASLSGAATV